MHANKRTTLTYFQFSSNSIMVRSIQPLVLGRVVGDILDPFIPMTELQVFHSGGRMVYNGGSLRPSHVVNQPRVEIGSGDGFRALYTLVMVDADAPTPTNPNLREYLHWMVTNIPGCTDAGFGQEVVCYENPQPSMGIHRIVFVLFRQMERQTIEAPGSRQNFNTRRFSDLYNLGLPVAAVYYNCQRENGTGGRRAY